MLKEYDDVFSETQWCSSTVKYDIVHNTTGRIEDNVDSVSIHLKTLFEEEVDWLLQQGIIKISSYQHCSPVVMVAKAGGCYRIVND